MTADAAFLSVQPLRGYRRKDKRFIANNAGADVIHQVLTKAGATVELASARTASSYPVILVALTSYQDMIQLYRAVWNRPEWQPGQRKFTVIAGGFGLQNPLAVRQYIDIAVFGRAEQSAPAILQAAQRGEFPALKQCADPQSWGEPVEVHQARTLFEGQMQGVRESFTGCPLKCKFCHYTFARKHLGSDHAYSRTGTTAGAYVVHANTRSSNHAEVTWPQIMDWPHDYLPSNITVGMDGWSQRLRFTYGKRIADWEVTAGIERIAHKALAFGKEFISLRVYQIDGFPGEDVSDRKQFERAVGRARPPAGVRVRVEVHVTPFRASVLTPMTWEAYSAKSIQNLGTATFCQQAESRLLGIYDQWMESPWGVLNEAVCARHDGSAAHDLAFKSMILAREFSKRKGPQKMRLFDRHFGVANFMGQREIGSPLPTDCLYSYVTHADRAGIARKMRRDVAAGMKIKGGKTICGNPIQPPPDVGKAA